MIAFSKVVFTNFSSYFYSQLTIENLVPPATCPCHCKRCVGLLVSVHYASKKSSMSFSVHQWLCYILLYLVCVWGGRFGCVWVFACTCEGRKTCGHCFSPPTCESQGLKEHVIRFSGKHLYQLNHLTPPSPSPRGFVFQNCMVWPASYQFPCC